MSQTALGQLAYVSLPVSLPLPTLLFSYSSAPPLFPLSLALSFWLCLFAYLAPDSFSFSTMWKDFNATAHGQLIWLKRHQQQL